MQNEKISMPKIKISKQKCTEIFERLAKTWPHAKCELVHNTHFQLLLAVMLSAQTTDKSVNKALEPLFIKKPHFSSKDLIKMGEDKFYEAIRQIGLAPTKAKNALAMAKILEEKHGGMVPNDRDLLEELPGVGRKTANVVLNVLFQHPLIAVDTHVERVAKRLGLASSEASRLEVEEALMKAVPEKYLVDVHHWLIFHGRYLCIARKPRCLDCPIQDICPKRLLTSSSR